MDFDQLMERATGHAPYGYQRRIAEGGLPELLRAPTGAGKTAGAVMGWLYRRRHHPDPEVRRSTPRRLVFVLPLRTLVEQTRDVAKAWLGRVDTDVDVHTLMGGEGGTEWLRWLERDAVLVGTLDMLLSRALNRGYGESRFLWPVSFGLLNADCAWVFDEVQLMGPALPTSRQLEGLRRSIGTATPCTSTWMSATVDPGWLGTVDLEEVRSTVELDQSDRSGPLARRLQATKAVHRLPVGPDPRRRPMEVADAVHAAHKPGTRTIAVLNTVKGAVEVWQALGRRERPTDVVLLHSRFRPDDRAAHLQRALAPVDPGGPGTIVVTTQVLEAGIDLTSTTLFTEAAPWSSVVQRAGRCNRDGEAEGATLLWAPPGGPRPYAEEDVAASAAALEALEGMDVTPEGLAGQPVPTLAVHHPVLRRRDLLSLFDTAPDLSGNDVDVGRFLRDTDGLDVSVAWRELGRDERGRDQGPEERALPERQERCPVPLPGLREALRAGRLAWHFDHLDERWARTQTDQLRPGMVLVMPCGGGGYDAELGWDPASTVPVASLQAQGRGAAGLGVGDVGTSDDPATFSGRWVALLDHLEEVECSVRELAGGLDPPGLSTEMVEAAAVAGRLHDVGKAHDAFQDMLLRTEDYQPRTAELQAGRPWAKSAHPGRGGYPPDRRHFRHELVSVLALLGAGVDLVDVAERELAVYLVGAHHGRVRLSIRSLPDDGRPRDRPDRRAALGVWEGDELDEVTVPGGVVPAQSLDLAPMAVGLGADGRPSWSEMALGLRDRPDLGPFRLAWLEALVRMADWRMSSAGATGEGGHG